MKLSVIIPVYNEEATIREIVNRVRALPLDLEIIVVDDCSTDGTPGILKSEIEGKLGQVVYQKPNRGKGAAAQASLLSQKDDLLAAVQDRNQAKFSEVCGGIGFGTK